MTGFGPIRFFVNHLQAWEAGTAPADYTAADAMLGKGDLDGQAVWLRILAAIEALLEKRPGDGAAVH